MNKYFPLFFGLICFSLTLLGQAEQRIALVIGNGNYTYSSKLGNPANDADSVAATLKTLGFEVISRKNVNRRNMQAALDQFESQLSVAKNRSGRLVSLFYYSGHGMQINGQNYLIPINSNIKSGADVRYEAINLQRTVDRLESHGNFLNIIMLDACRDNPLTKSLAGKSGSPGLFEGYAPPEGTGKSGMFISFATAPGKVADSGDRRMRNSPYVEAFTEHVYTPNLSIDDLFNRVGKSVLQRTARTQIPYKTGAFFDFFTFKKGPTATPKTTILPDDMVFISGGRFQMGDQFGDGSSNEKPVHIVTLDNFHLARHELTVEEFSTFIATSGYLTDADKDGGSTIWTGSEWEKMKGINWQYDTAGKLRPRSEFQHPVIHISWYDAIHYCNWRSQIEGLVEVFTINGNKVSCNWVANGYRLPTEAEWEFAARERGKKVRFGNGQNFANPKEINFYGKEDAKIDYSVVGIYRSKTTEVGSFSSNALDLYDMSGNVWEWCWDRYGTDYYKKSQNARNPCGPDSGFNRVVRGGSWNYYPSYVRAADRDSSSPGFHGNMFGFRLARAAR